MSEKKENKYKVRSIVLTLMLHAVALILCYFLILNVPNLYTDIGSSGLILGAKSESGEEFNYVAFNSASPALATDDERDIAVKKDIIFYDLAREEDASVIAIKKEPHFSVNHAERVGKQEKNVDNRFTLHDKNSREGRNGISYKHNRNKDMSGYGIDRVGEGAVDSAGMSFSGGLVNWKVIGNPYPEDRSQESGVLVFKVYVNRKGVIEKVELVQNRGIMPTTIDLYKEHIRNALIFIPPAGVSLPEYTVGTITYHIDLH